MKYKASLIACAAIIVVLALSFFVCPEVTSSELEMRNMATFGMILDPVDDIDPNTGEKSVLYNADKSIPDRLEDALKDQIFIRNFVVLNYTDLESKFANLYSDVTKVLTAPFKQDTPIEDDGTEETDPPVTVPDEGFPDEYYDLAKEEEAPTELDFDKYPGYGFARLAAFSSKSYEYRSIGNYVSYNGTDWVGPKPSKSVPSKSSVQRHVDQYEKLIKEYPNLKIYNYFVTQLKDAPWFYESFGQQYPDWQEIVAQYMPEYVEIGRLTFDNFEDYTNKYFKTDHHWSYKGSEQGYEDVYAMMADDLDLSPMKYPIKTWNFSELYGVEYRGSRVSGLPSSYTAYDEFIAYEYDLGERQTFVAEVDLGEADTVDIIGDYTKEIPVTMGLWERYKVGNIKMGADHYISFYGNAYDENGRTYADSKCMFIIKNNNGAEHNLLMVCDSTQRAYRDVLGSHFGTVVTLDYRFIDQVPIDYIIEKYNIDTMLVGGLSFAWSGSNKYMFVFSENFGK